MKPADAQIKVRIDPELKAKLEEAFARQGVSMTEGLTRLVRSFLEAGEDLHPLLLEQVRGRNRKDLAKAILRRWAK